MNIQNSKKSILIFTDKYPFGSGESFFETELYFLSKTFDKISILPLENLNQKTYRKLPESVKLLDSPFNSVKNKFELLKKGLFNKVPIRFYLLEFFRSRVFLSFNRFWNWVTYCLLVRAEISFIHNREKELNFNDYEILYFYWGLRWSQILPFISFNSKIVTRFHGSDLYEERNSNYIPFRAEQIKNIDLLVFISEMGKNYILNRYPHVVKQTVVSRLGTDDFGIQKFDTNVDIHIVSCSNIIPLKQVDLLANALKYVQVKIKWTHIGDGPLRNKIVQIVDGLRQNVIAEFKGQLSHIELMKFYKETSVSVFVNTSLSEGVPVSVMEAMSFGIPVIATDVGGTSEIVDEKVGRLILPDIKPEILAQEIINLVKKVDYMQLRQNARKRWEEKCKAEILFQSFADNLKNL